MLLVQWASWTQHHGQLFRRLVAQQSDLNTLIPTTVQGRSLQMVSQGASWWLVQIGD